MRIAAQPLPANRPAASPRPDGRLIDSAQTLRERTRRAAAAIRARWNPERHVPWQRFERERYSSDHLAAAALTWSLRADRLQFTVAPATRLSPPGTLEADEALALKLKAGRDASEAREAACCRHFARLLGGPVTAEPMAPRGSNPGGMHAGWVTAATLLDSLDLARDRAARAHAADPVARELLRRLITDRARRLALQWRHLHTVSWQSASEERDAIADAVLQDLMEGGALTSRLAWLAPSGNEWLEANAITRLVGLGGLLPDEEAGIVGTALGAARARLAAMGIHLPDLATTIGA